MPICTSASPQNAMRFEAIAITSAGVPATSHATTAVTARPANIHPYTTRRNEVTRPATPVAAPAYGSRADSYGFTETLLVSGEADSSIGPRQPERRMCPAPRGLLG